MKLFYKEISTNGKSLRMSGDNTASNLSQFGIQAFKLATDANGKVIGVSDVPKLIGTSDSPLSTEKDVDFVLELEYWKLP